MDLTNLEELRLQVGRLIEYELLDSAESVLQLALSKLRPDPNSKEIQALCYQLIGDICHKRSEFKRALSYYNQALQQLKFTKRSSSQSSSSSSDMLLAHFQTLVPMSKLIVELEWTHLQFVAYFSMHLEFSLFI